MLDIGKLATLSAAVAHGSFSAAGHALGLTQPAVSRQVSLLERQVGTQLVRRTQQGVRPTEAGRLLVAHADAIVGRLALAEAEVADLAGLRRGRLRLGSFFTALVDRAGALAGLAAGELDLAVVFEHEFEPAAGGAGAVGAEDVEIVPLFDDPP